MWQQFLVRRPELAFVSVAVDVDRRRPVPYAKHLPFPTLVDSAGQLGRLFDFDVVPNGVFVDEQGVIRFMHMGGFDIRRAEVDTQVESLLHADFSDDAAAPNSLQQEALDIELLRVGLAVKPDDGGLQFALGEALLREGRLAEAETTLRRAAELDANDWSARFGLGTAQYQQGRTADALVSWRAALTLDPANFTVRKQIWMIEHPEKFYPAIDFDWQKEQLAREGHRR